MAGDIQVQGNNISLTEGSQIESSTLGTSPSQENPGTVKINALDTMKIDGKDSSNSFSSGIFSQVYPDAVGNSGELNITTTNLSLTKDSLISAATFGTGDVGSIDINAAKSINLDNSLIENSVGKDATGNGGNIDITTANLSVTKGSINSDTDGQGDAGSININATKSINLDNGVIYNRAGSTDGITKAGYTRKRQGNGGNVNITTANLSVTNSGSIRIDTIGQADAGLLDINATESIALDDNSYISTSIVGNFNTESNGGNIQISTGDFFIFNDSRVDVSTSSLGNGGDIEITADNFSLTNGGDVIASTFGEKAENIAQGDGGNISIDVAENLSINGTINGATTGTGIFASNQGGSSGNAGNIDITTSELFVTNGGQINSFTRGSGNGGNTTINAQDSIFLSGEDSEGIVSGLFNNVDEAATGNGGTIKITTNNLGIFDGAAISLFSSGQGDAGLIDINVNILSLDNGSITAQAFNNIDGGNLKIDANVIVAYPDGNSDIIASAEQGNGGNITINAESLLGIEQRPLNDSTNDINASSQVRGLDGVVKVNTLDINPLQGAVELPSNIVEAKQTAEQTCSADRDGKVNNGLAIAGRGGVHPAPNLPLNSENISNHNSPVAAIPQPIETSQGKIQPARGIMVTKSGKIVLTAYRTNDAGERIPEIEPNCKTELGN